MPDYVVTWIHLVGAIAFIGGWLFFLLAVRPCLQDQKGPLPSAESLEFVKKMGNRFKTVGWVSLMVLIFTGASQLLDESGSARIETSWGLIMMLKLFVFAIVGGLIFVHDLILDPYGVTAKGHNPKGQLLMFSGKVVWVQRSIVVLSLAILGIAVYLTAH